MSKIAQIAQYRILWVTVSLVLFLDQLTKIWMVSYSGLSMGDYAPYGGIEVIPGFFNLCLIANEGAAWGLFKGFSGGLAVLAMVALVAIYYFRKLLGLKRPAIQLAFGIICGGIVGNLIDRVRLGYVIDFLDFQLPFQIPMILETGRWPAFNVADIGITCGVALYIILTWSEPEPEPEDTGQADAS